MCLTIYRCYKSASMVQQKTHTRKLRLGGKWEKIKENMEHISKVKDQYHFLWHFDFVVQRDNFREIPMLLEWADRLGVDAVNLKPIEDWNTYTDIKQYQVWKKIIPTMTSTIQ